MLSRLKRFLIAKIGRKRSASEFEVDPDITFLDSSNLPQFNVSQFEGRLERPISERTIAAIGAFFLLITLGFGGRLWSLQIVDGADFAVRSENNVYRQAVLFADRGAISDRNGVE